MRFEDHQIATSRLYWKTKKEAFLEAADLIDKYWENCEWPTTMILEEIENILREKAEE